MEEDFVYNPDLTQPVDASDASSAATDEGFESEPDGASPSPAPVAQEAPDAEYVEVDLDENGVIVPDDVEDETESESEDTDGDADDGDDAEPDLATLKEKAKRAEELEAQIAEEEAAREEQALQATWGKQEKDFDAWCVKYWRDHIQPDIDQRVDREAAMQKARAWMEQYRINWYRQFERSKYEVLEERHNQLGAVLFAQELCRRVGLPADVQQELLAYPPELMEREARRIKKHRQEVAELKRKATLADRKQARTRMANESIAPGSGRGTTVRLRADSDEYYHAIPWQRSR